MEKDCKRIIFREDGEGMGIDQYLEMVDTNVKPIWRYLPTFLILKDPGRSKIQPYINGKLNRRRIQIHTGLTLFFLSINYKMQKEHPTVRPLPVT